MSKLTEDLLAARQEMGSLEEALDMLRKREEDAALSLAANKMTIHRELEAKEEQIRCLRDSLAQITHDKEALVERGK
jgi:1-pyrroline-5-carboxylate dehydrogenase